MKKQNVENNVGNYVPSWGLRQWMKDYMEGRKTLPFTYDPFFRYIFDPDIHPKRLERFLASLLKKEVIIKKILPREGSTIVEDGSLLIMDIVVELVDGSLANIEIQKIPFRFPAQRMSCYSSDLVMRQYSRVRGERGSANSYQHMNKVYTIVLFEKTIKEFHCLPQFYVHNGSTKFDTGLEVELLQEYCLVALDIFREFHYHKASDECSGWLSFLTTEEIDDVETVLEKYPWLGELYEDATRLQTNPKEVESMFSEALQIMDRNAMQYMIDEQKETIDGQKETIDEQNQRITEQQHMIEELQEEIDRLKGTGIKQ